MITSPVAHLCLARSVFVGLGASLCLFAGCGISAPSKATGTGGSGGSAATTHASSSSGAVTSSTGVSTTSGSASTSASTGTGGGAEGCSSLPLCEGFESDTAGAAPSINLWTIVNEGGCGNSSTSGFSVLVSTVEAHSGTHSLAVTGGDSCGPLMVNTSAFPKITGGDVYGRFYVFLPTATAFNHAGMMTLGLTANANPPGMSLNQSANLELASESVNNAPVFTWQTTDGNILPDKDTMGAATTTYPAANTWTCVEFHTSASNGALETWVNGTAVSGLTFVPGTTAKTQGVNDQWTPLSPFAPTSLGLGWINFGGSPFTLYFDDIALDSSRIGCM